MRCVVADLCDGPLGGQVEGGGDPHDEEGATHVQHSHLGGPTVGESTQVLQLGERRAEVAQHDRRRQDAWGVARTAQGREEERGNGGSLDGD